MKNSFFSRFTPKEPKFFPLLKQLSEVLSASSVALVESLQHDQPAERSEYYKKIKDLEREGDRLTHLIFDELGTTFITPFDREDIHDLASCMDDVIDGINSCAKRISIYNPRPISESGKELSRLIQEEAIYICKAMDELETFRKKPTLLREYCSKLHEIDSVSDDGVRSSNLLPTDNSFLNDQSNDNSVQPSWSFSPPYRRRTTYSAFRF